MNDLMEGIDKAISGFNKMSHNPINEVNVRWLGDGSAGGLKRVTIRDAGETTSLSGMIPKNTTIKPKQKDVIGWFTNKHNVAFGWAVCRLSSFDKSWLGSNSKNAFRVFTEKGTSIVQFNLVGGTYAFLDNAYYEETDKVRFAKKSAYQKFFIDDFKYLQSDFGYKLTI